MKIKYIPVYTEDLEKQLGFFTEKLGMEVTGTKSVLFGQECTLIKTNNSNVFIVVFKQPQNHSKPAPIIINTDDCLNDYHSLRMAGVNFYNEPQYMPIGLGAEFLDPFGNRYLLIEERSYC